MKQRVLLLMGCAVIVGGAIVWRFWPQRGAARQAAGSAVAGASLPAVPAAATKPGLNTATDPAAVFQRAFWRRPDASVRILGAERREWADEKTSVQKWQWFLSLETKPEFRRWLLEQNPFELVRATADAPMPDLSVAPAWFPPLEELRALSIYRAPGSGLRIFVESSTGRLFATDAGGGLTAAMR